MVGKCDDQVVLRRTIDIKESLTTVREKFESIEFCSAADKQEPVKLHAVESEGEITHKQSWASQTDKQVDRQTNR